MMIKRLKTLEIRLNTLDTGMLNIRPGFRLRKALYEA